MDEATIIVGGITAVHAVENFVVARLNRDLNMLADLGKRGYSFNQLVIHPIGVRGEKAYSF